VVGRIAFRSRVVQEHSKMRFPHKNCFRLPAICRDMETTRRTARQFEARYLDPHLWRAAAFHRTPV
jgi:hypothetical protein